MSGTRFETRGEKGNAGKLIEESCENPAHDSLEFLETVLEFYLPGIDHKSLSDEAFARKLGHVSFLIGKKKL